MQSCSKICTIIALTAFSLFPTNASASSWETFRSSNTNNAAVFDNAGTSNFSGATFEIDGAGSFTTPVMAEGKLFFAKYRNGTNISEVLAVSLTSGNIIWQKSYFRQIQRILYDDGKLYFGADKFYCLNASDGSELWTRGIDIQGNAITWAYVYRIANSKVLGWEAQASTKNFLALNASDGSTITNLGNYNFGSVREIVADGSNFYFNKVSGSGSSTQTGIESYSLSDFSQNWASMQSCPADNGNIMIDADEDMIYLSSSDYRFCGYDQNTGARYFYTPNSPLRTNFSKYGDRIYAYSATTNGVIASFDPKAKNGSVTQTQVLENETFASAPTIVNDVIYGATSLGRIWGMNLESGERKLWNLGTSEDFLNYIAYADGRFAVRSKSDTNPKIYLVDAFNFDLAYPDQYTISLESPYKTDGDYNSYLGQLHAHWRPDVEKWSKVWNGEPSPAFVEQEYRDKGYNFIALTEHDELTPDPGVGGILHIVNAEEDGISENPGHILAIGVNDTINEYLPAQERINQIMGQGGIAIMAHPNSRPLPWTLKQLHNNKGYHALEIFNGFGSQYPQMVIPAGYWQATDKADNLLFADRKIWLSANDDYTPGDGGQDNAAVVVFSKNLNQTEILQNLKDGNFYAVQGSGAPRIEISVAGGTITVTSNQSAEIKFIGKGGAELQKEEEVSVSTYTAKGDEVYVRAEVQAGNDINGRRAWSQPVFVKKVRSRDTSSYGKRYISLGKDALLVSNTTDAVEAKTLDASQYPTQTPPSGYLSQIYSLLTSGQVLEGTKLSFNYTKGLLTTNEDNLSIYSYNESSSSWGKTASTVDKTKQTVSTDLTHFSLYALSAETPEDTTSPQISLASPTNLDNLFDIVQFDVNASDNNIVSRIDFAVDNIAQATDTDASDGWSAILDMNDYAIGEHTLTVSAEDPAGNISVSDYRFTVADSSFTAPTVDMSFPAEGSYLSGVSKVTGSYFSQKEIKSLSLYLDDIFISDADALSTDNFFTKSIDWDQFKEGEHTLKVELVDAKGNIALDSAQINIGEEQNVEILSPQEETYMQSETIQFKYMPEDQSLTAKLDGIGIANNSNIKLLDYTLGEHTLTVEKEGKVVAERKFSISTNLNDMEKVTTVLFNENHITNKGIYFSILLHIKVAKIFESFGWIKSRDRILGSLEHYVAIQSKGKKPKIDEYARKILISDIEYLLLRQ